MLTIPCKPTLTAVELDHGETVEFVLQNGESRTLTLEDTEAFVFETNLENTKKEQGRGCTVLRFTAKVRVDGEQMLMERYLCTQESFYEPYVVNGLRIWFDGVAKIFDHIIETHGPCKPEKAARFAFQDATLPICPEPLAMWCPRDTNRIDISETYNGDDCWMGPYMGASAHGGLDINHPRGTILRAPFDIDDHYWYDKVSSGANNNRWRGFRTWPDGSTWTIQTAHTVEPLVEEHTPLKAGTAYATGAGVRVGCHDHSHFVFKVADRGQEILLDPWILFWQMFEQRKKVFGEIHAGMKMLAPAKTGENLHFAPKGSRTSLRGGELACHWTFGDGGVSRAPEPMHTYMKPGVYPVTLTVDDGSARASWTQHNTVSGEDQTGSALVLAAPDELSFRKRPVHAMDVYGETDIDLPNVLRFYARPSKPVTAQKEVLLQSSGKAPVPEVDAPDVKHLGNEVWLMAEVLGEAGQQSLRLTIDAIGFEPGVRRAEVAVNCPGALNSPQSFIVELHHLEELPHERVVLDDDDPGFECTPHFWMGGRFCYRPEPGYGNFYLTNGGRPVEGEWARFTPDLAAGTYRVSLSHMTPYSPGAKFQVRVRSLKGDEAVWVEPQKSRTIGRFKFDEGMDGFVELQAGGSEGHILADAVLFERIEE